MLSQFRYTAHGVTFSDKWHGISALIGTNNKGASGRFHYIIGDDT